jgi:hypothetical protein
MEYRNLNVTGSVNLAPTISLAETAAKLTLALQVMFNEDPAGTCDEFPSFSAQCAGHSFMLLGIPELSEQIGPEPIVDYTLHIGMEFRVDGAITDRCDASSYFADLIRERTDLTVIEP